MTIIHLEHLDGTISRWPSQAAKDAIKAGIGRHTAHKQQLKDQRKLAESRKPGGRRALADALTAGG